MGFLREEDKSPCSLKARLFCHANAILGANLECSTELIREKISCSSLFWSGTWLTKKISVLALQLYAVVFWHLMWSMTSILVQLITISDIAVEGIMQQKLLKITMLKCPNRIY
ncbi:hypothetical protein VNO78_27508 [Psophocarpus tetragonolobus]|uniref:Uncharacterized protein n=1 Tax=Psophocarpus tetragonolobus TaxID=3891 RepID=A0AAN9S183_PSOTE